MRRPRPRRQYGHVVAACEIEDGFEPLRQVYLATNTLYTAKECRLLAVWLNEAARWIGETDAEDR